MSLRIRRIALSNFRKYRAPFVLDGLTDGLNVIIEPNETGKSTLLEAMRAAFFIRHNTANRLRVAMRLTVRRRPADRDRLRGKRGGVESQQALPEKCFG